MADFTRCPECGAADLEDLGFIFIEDGPWDGKRYRNEGEFCRYRCAACRCVFGYMPEPLLCGDCGERITGELGEDCEEDPQNEGRYLCEECMKKGDS